MNFCKLIAVGQPATNARRRSLLCTLMLGLMFLAGTRLLAQGITGTISGTVTDPSGATVSGATVTVRQTSTNTVHAVTTSDNGSFTATQLPPGDYTVEVEHQGFEHFRQTGVHLTIDQTVSLTPVLPLGATTETIDVSAAAPVIQTSESSVGSVVESQAIQNTPLNGRLSLMGLIALAPGVQGVGAQDQLATRGLTFAGGTGSRNSYGGLSSTLDGV